MHQKPVTKNRDVSTLNGIDRQLLVQAMVDLHIARRNVLIYPISHEQVKRSIIRSFKSLAKVIEQSSGVTLTVLKKGVGIGDQILDAKSATLIELASVLKQYEIATITFETGLVVKELARFLQLISADREKIMAKGGIAEVVGKGNFPSIQVQTVDYSQLQVTEEEEIHHTSEASEERGSIWQQFVNNVASHPKGGGIALMTPGSLADMLNEGGVDVQQVVDQYRSLLSSAQVSAAGHRNMAEELQAFQQMIRELDVGIKEQFLSATYDHCGQLATVAEAAHLVDGLGGDLIIQMLRKASTVGRKISPSLLSFINKMGQVERSSALQMEKGGDGGQQKGFSEQNIEALMAYEQYDTYIDDHYDELLDHLTREFQLSNNEGQGLALSHSIQRDLKGTNILTHVGRALVRLMHLSSDSGAYRGWARQLAYLLDDLLANRAYGYMTRMMTFLRREKKAKDNERAEIAALVLDRFSDPQFVTKAIVSVKSAGREADSEALIFLLELGEPVVVGIFDGLDPQENFDEQNVLNRILDNLSSITAQEALERLKDPRPDYVLRMIEIIRRLGDSDTVQQLKSLMDHGDLSVRIEALATLLNVENKWGRVRLRELLNDPAGEAFEYAAELAGRYAVKAVVPQLEHLALKGGELGIRETAVQTLGRIGDPAAVPTLRRIVRPPWYVLKRQSRELKRAVYDTLEAYPMEDVHDLLRYGLKQKDDAIRLVSERLLREGGGRSAGGETADNDPSPGPQT